jgi:hypothetical protein
MRLLKLVSNVGGIRKSSTFECPHFTIKETAEFFEIECPVFDEETQTWPMKTVRLPEDGYAIYHMHPSTGDTLDSWTWRTDQAEHRNYRKGTEE